jgi:hypothetical protein
MPSSFDSSGMFKMHINMPSFELMRNLVPGRAIAIEVEYRMRKAMDTFERNLYRMLSRPGTGKWYPSKTGFGRHRASRPGKPPAPDRTTYKFSWETHVRRSGERIEAGVTSPLWKTFGRRLELGGWSSGRWGSVFIAPRPHLQPAWDESEPEMDRILREGS